MIAPTHHLLCVAAPGTPNWRPKGYLQILPNYASLGHTLLTIIEFLEKKKWSLFEIVRFHLKSSFLTSFDKL